MHDVQNIRENGNKLSKKSSWVEWLEEKKKKNMETHKKLTIGERKKFGYCRYEFSGA